ncbi:hypothetical protein CHLNCDRAFT_28011 [Chlorella variabilis]|uniref:Signal recognition particle 14 kDa protein n=1 Tax=Chlorella variabilis TaxID=554065 RepID=E1ZRR1_CHLVA|nr:hypothetical protein CHLNCDRAFT_28011 [Chlorella variabilis]EFN51456.1 hypothetical protein CHLNCDRAFT_28011 [Chlorella variabilis]|eukprot:XP_005843558.1 hypothetical protein CHLNCDRAFT_28011 [Chlorella variabilis]
MLQDNSKFLNELLRMYQANRELGSVWVTMKRTNLKPRRSKKDYSGLACHCLVRATDGRKKLSTVVEGRDLARFNESYSTILKGHMDSLKKRVRHAAKLAQQQ